MDVALILVLLVAIAALGVAGWVVARIEDTRGFFDPPLLTEVEDRRILTDYRDTDAPIVDMIGHGTRAVIGRSDGTVHRYDARTELFQDNSLPGAPDRTETVAFLGSACTDPAACGDTDTVFAVTNMGGLYADTAGRGWETLISDSVWTGNDGLPVEQEAIALWSVSDDGRWLLAVSNEQGLGLFDQSDSLWTVLDLDRDAPPPQHIAFAQGVFWLAGEGGLTTIDPGGDAPRQIRRSDAPIIDLERAFDGDLLALSAAPCDGGTCLAILEIGGVDRIRRVVGETAISPDLSSATLVHAAMQGDRIVVLGGAGVHSYDSRQRAWSVLEPAGVDTFHAGPNGDVLHIAAGETVARVADGRITWQTSAPDLVEQILPVGTAAVYALLRDGSVVDLAPPEPRVIVPAESGPGAGARIDGGITVDDTVLLQRGTDLVLHHPTQRHWAELAGVLPPNAGATARLVGDTRHFWLVDADVGRVWEGALQGDWPVRSVTFTDVVSGLGRLQSVQADDGALYLLLADGSPLRLAAGSDAPVRMTGRAAPQGFQPNTGAAGNGMVWFSDGRRIAAYDQIARNWNGPWSGPPGGVRDLEVTSATLIALAQDGVLFASEGDVWATVSGAPGGLAIGAEQVTDARYHNGSIYIGGAGQVLEYLPSARREIARYGGGSGDVRIVSVRDGAPIWWSGGRLLQAERRLSEPGERVTWAGRTDDGLLYTAEQSGRSYAVSLSDDRQCLFRGSPAPSEELVDARALPDGRVFVATTTGLAIHEARFRRWTALVGPGVSVNARFEFISDHLVILDGRNTRSMPLSSLPSPHSCDDRAVEVAWSSFPPFAQAVHDGGGDRLLMLDSNGRVSQWRGGSSSTLLPATNGGPVIADLQRARSVSGGLMLGSADRLWRYHQATRTWDARAVTGGSGTASAFDFQIEDGEVHVTVWDDLGQGYGGGAASGDVSLRPLIGPRLPRPQQDPSAILDMVQSDAAIAILGHGTLELFDHETAAPSGRIDLPQARATWHLGALATGGRFVLTDGDRNAPERLFVLDRSSQRSAVPMTLDAASFAYTPGSDLAWRLDANTLWRIDERLVLHQCAITVGREAAETCQAIGPAPDRIDPNAVLSAGRAGDGGYWARVDDTLLRIGRTWRVDTRFGMEDLQDEARFIALPEALVFWTGFGGDLWLMPPMRAPERLLRGVTYLQSNGDRLSVASDLGLVSVGPTGQVSAFEADGSALVAAALEPTGAVVGLGPDGRLRPAGSVGQPLSDIILPLDTRAATRGLAPGEVGSGPQVVWSQGADDRIRAHWMGLCQPLIPLRRDLGWPEPEWRERLPADAIPGPEPCPQTFDTDILLAENERLLFVSGEAAAPALRTTQALYRLGPNGTVTSRTPDRSQAVPVDPQSVTDIRSRIVEVVGQSYLAPPELRSVGGRTRVYDGAQEINAFGGGGLIGLTPFSSGGLTWERDGREIRFSNGQALVLNDALIDGRFLPDTPGRAAYLGGDSFALLNPHGLWQVRIATSVQPIRIAPSRLPIDIANGQFLYPDRAVDARSGDQSAAPGTDTLTLGALRITETVLGGGLSADYLIDGAYVPATARQGFAFDQRLGITASDGTGFLVTPIGLIPAATLAVGRAVPQAVIGFDTEGTAAMAQRATGWQRLGPTGWTASAPPWTNRLLAEGDGRRWERRNGRIEINPLDPTDAFAVARRGLSFEGDRLIAMAADDSGIVAVLGTGTVEVADWRTFAAHVEPVVNDPGAQALDALDIVPGQSVLWAQTTAGQFTWDRAISRWRPPISSEEPWIFRVPVSESGLRFAFRRGQLEAAIEVEDLNGTRGSRAFSWRAGQNLPFDTVRAITVEDDRLLLATDFGLRRLDWRGSGPRSMELYSGVNNSPPIPFSRVGRPASDPSRLLATAGDVCFEMADADAAPVPCAVPTDLRARVMASDALWRWTEGDTALSGTYLDYSGRALAPARIDSLGRWPHDRLRRVASCSGSRAELWEEADVVAILDSRGIQALQSLPGADGFWCERRGAELGQGRALAPALYASGGTNAWRYFGPEWRVERNAADIAARLDGEIPWEASRLRLRSTNAGLLQEVRGLDDTWHPIAWDGDRPDIDRVTGIAGAGRELLLLTRAGVLDWSVGRRMLDADTVILRTPVDRDGFADCGPTRIDARDGSVHAVPALPGGPIDILCNDGTVWRGDPDAMRDVGVFANESGRSDIVGDRVLIDEDGWVWTRRIDASGAASFSILFRDEPVSLDGGRLSVDDYAGLAAPYRGTLDIVTQGAGWWRYPRINPAVTAGQRPDPAGLARRAVSLHSDQIDGAPRLCVGGTGEGDILVEETGDIARTPGCRDVRGEDRTYTYYARGLNTAAEGLALNGLPLTRTLQEGRFEDLFVIGAPMTDGDNRLFVPTRAGILTMSDRGPEGTYARSDPSYLVPDTGGVPVALGAGGATPLTGGEDPACGGLAGLSGRLPEGAHILRVQDAGRDAVSVLVTIGAAERVSLLVPCRALEETLFATVPVTVDARGRYTGIGSASGTAPFVAWSRDGRIALTDANSRTLAIDALIEGQVRGQMAVPDGRAVIFATGGAIHRLDIDRALNRFAAGDASQSYGVPPGPFASPPPASPAEPRGDAEDGGGATVSPMPTESPDLPLDPAVPQLIGPARPTQSATTPTPADSTPDAAPDADPFAALDDREAVRLSREEWRDVQQVLREEGHYLGAIDGIAGPVTRAAIERWQRQAGREANGILTARQRAEILGRLP
jgi:hypothetical protein